MQDETELLAELMLHATQFCNAVGSLEVPFQTSSNEREFYLKLGQARNILERLQQSYNEGLLSLDDKVVAAEFRQLVIALLWIAFYRRHQLDFKTFRRVAMVEASFTYLLIGKR